MEADKRQSKDVRDEDRRDQGLDPRATSSMIGGAALGSAIGGPIGALVGGVAGWALGAGLVARALQHHEKQKKGD
jgi:hypothetical protein